MPSAEVFRDKDQVVLSLVNTLFKENIEKLENARVVEKIISEYLGRPCKIKCVCEMENNHLVRAALKQGAEIVSVEEK